MLAGASVSPVASVDERGRRMRFSATTALTLLLGWMLLSGVAAAQATARNTVTVHIPTVLRLRIDQGTASATRSLDVTVEGAVVHPGSVNVKVFANTDWTLSISDDNGGATTLDVCTDAAAMTGCMPIAPEVEIAAGGMTGGWMDHTVGFRVDPQSSLTATRSTHTLTFTLSRP